jgi:DNA-binding XRE family transcriptional regulator
MSLSIKQARLMKDLRQTELAEKLGIHVQTYRKIEQNPELATIMQAKKISEIVNIPYDQIFFSENST